LVPGATVRNVELFYWIYFAMTGMHALHMIIGIGLLITLTIMAWRGRFGPEYHAPNRNLRLYWHFVDIIWIFCFRCSTYSGGIWKDIWVDGRFALARPLPQAVLTELYERAHSSSRIYIAIFLALMWAWPDSAGGLS